MKPRMTFLAALVTGSLLVMGGCWPSLPSSPEDQLDEDPHDDDVDSPDNFTGQVSFALWPEQMAR